MKMAFKVLSWFSVAKFLSVHALKIGKMEGTGGIDKMSKKNAPCPSCMEVSLVLDATPSIGSDEAAVRDFGLRLVDELDCDSGKVHFRIIHFSDAAVTDTDRTNDCTVVRNAVNAYGLVYGATNIAAGISAGRFELDTYTGTCTKIIILLTDGRNTDKNWGYGGLDAAVAAANTAKAKPAGGEANILFAIGFKGASLSDLQAIATSSNHAFYHTDITEATRAFESSICDVLPTPSTTPTTSTTTSVNSCFTGLNMAIVMDATPSIGALNEPKVRNFATKVIEHVHVAGGACHVAVIEFNDFAKELGGLSASQSNIEGAIAKYELPAYDASTNICSGVEKGVDLLGVTSTVPRVIILLSDGENKHWYGGPDAAVKCAKEAKDKGVIFFAVGFGKAENVTLQAMASMPSSIHAYYHTDLDTLTNTFSDQYCLALP